MAGHIRVGVPPDIVTVAAAAAGPGPDLSAIARPPECAVRDHQVVRLVRRHANPDVVAGAANQPAIPAHVAPALPAIVRSPERPLRLGLEPFHAVRARLDQRVHPVAVGGRDRDVGLAIWRLRQAGRGDLRERLATVARDVDAAAVATAIEVVRLQFDLPGAREDHIRIFLRHLESRAARVLIHEQGVLPGLAAVLAAEHAPLLLRAGRAAERADQHEILIGRMDDDRADAARLRQAHLRPRLAGVGGLVDAVAHHVHVADGPGLAGAGPHDVRIARRDSERADRLRRLVVERRLPGESAVDALPHAARRGARVVHAGFAGDGGRCRDAARARRPDVFEARRADRLRRLRSRGTTAAAALRRRGDREQTDGGEEGSARAEASPAPESCGHCVPQGILTWRHLYHAELGPATTGGR